MPFEHPTDALIEAAASGAEPQGELRAHLDACSSCRAAFAQEQSLFAFIDAGLRTTANSEVPVSLLPRVRAGLDEVVVPRGMWTQPLIFAAASVALVFLILLIVRPHRATPENMAKQSPVVAPTPVAPGTNANPGRIPAMATETASAGANSSHKVRSSTFFHPAASGNPEVLVPPDEREALVRFIAVLSQRSDAAAALFAQTTEKKDALVNADPLQIADIKIKPLEGGETENSNDAERR